MCLLHERVFLRFLRLSQFKRSLTLNSNPFGNDDEPRSHTGMGMGPGTGQRMGVDEIRQQQRDIIAGGRVTMDTVTMDSFVCRARSWS